MKNIKHNCDTNTDFIQLLLRSDTQANCIYSVADIIIGICFFTRGKVYESQNNYGMLAIICAISVLSIAAMAHFAYKISMMSHHTSDWNKLSYRKIIMLLLQGATVIPAAALSIILILAKLCHMHVKYDDQIIKYAFVIVMLACALFLTTSIIRKIIKELHKRYRTNSHKHSYDDHFEEKSLAFHDTGKPRYLSQCDTNSQTQNLSKTSIPTYISAFSGIPLIILGILYCVNFQNNTEQKLKELQIITWITTGITILMVINVTLSLIHLYRSHKKSKKTVNNDHKAMIVMQVITTVLSVGSITELILTIEFNTNLTVHGVDMAIVTLYVIPFIYALYIIMALTDIMINKRRTITTRQIQKIKHDIKNITKNTSSVITQLEQLSNTLEKYLKVISTEKTTHPSAAVHQTIMENSVQSYKLCTATINLLIQHIHTMTEVDNTNITDKVSYAKHLTNRLNTRIEVFVLALENTVQYNDNVKQHIKHIQDQTHDVLVVIEAYIFRANCLRFDSVTSMWKELEKTINKYTRLQPGETAIACPISHNASLCKEKILLLAQQQKNESDNVDGYTGTEIPSHQTAYDAVDALICAIKQRDSAQLTENNVEINAMNMQLYLVIDDILDKHNPNKHTLSEPTQSMNTNKDNIHGETDHDNSTLRGQIANPINNKTNGNNAPPDQPDHDNIALNGQITNTTDTDNAQNKTGTGISKLEDVSAKPINTNSLDVHAPKK